MICFQQSPWSMSHAWKQVGTKPIISRQITCYRPPGISRVRENLLKGHVDCWMGNILLHLGTTQAFSSIVGRSVLSPEEIFREFDEQHRPKEPCKETIIPLIFLESVHEPYPFAIAIILPEPGCPQVLPKDTLYIRYMKDLSD